MIKARLSVKMAIKRCLKISLVWTNNPSLWLILFSSLICSLKCCLLCVPVYVSGNPQPETLNFGSGVQGR